MRNTSPPSSPWTLLAARTEAKVRVGHFVGCSQIYHILTKAAGGPLHPRVQVDTHLLCSQHVDVHVVADVDVDGAQVALPRESPVPRHRAPFCVDSAHGRPKSLLAFALRIPLHDNRCPARVLHGAPHCTAGTMWRRVYFLLILVRVYFALSPSYLHPDENFQGPEVIAGTYAMRVCPASQLSDSPPTRHVTIELRLTSLQDASSPTPSTKHGSSPL
jgi:hypothetical protein